MGLIKASLLCVLIITSKWGNSLMKPCVEDRVLYEMYHGPGPLDGTKMLFITDWKSPFLLSLHHCVAQIFKQHLLR